MKREERKEESEKKKKSEQQHKAQRQQNINNNSNINNDKINNIPFTVVGAVATCSVGAKPKVHLRSGTQWY